MISDLVFLKLGGSLITDKRKEDTALHNRINNAVKGIKSALETRPDMQLLIGHGSGSFGHFPANKYKTREGVRSKEDWRGFIEVWQSARKLHQLVLQALSKAGLPVIGFAPSASAIINEGNIEFWDIRPIQAALEAKLIPVVYGDVAFDISNGGGILSTEELFIFLNNQLGPKRILLAANEPVFSDFPESKHALKEIGPFNFAEYEANLSGGEGSDTTGGMLSKVEAAMAMAKTMSENHAGSEVRIFSGKDENSIADALLGNPLGTLVSAKH